MPLGWRGRSQSPCKSIKQPLHVFGEKVMPVPCNACVYSISLSLCVPAHPGLCNEGCCGCCPGKGLGKDDRGWQRIKGSGAGLKFRGKKQ